MDNKDITNFFKDAVVQIRSRVNIGMGIVPATFGVIVTTYAMVKGCSHVTVVSQHLGRRTARVVYRDPLLQIAFIEIPEGFPHKEIPLGDVSRLSAKDNVKAAKHPYLWDFAFMEGTVGQTRYPFAGQYVIKSNGICPKCTVGGALLNSDYELMGLINTIIPKKIKESIAIPLPLLREALEAYKPYSGSEAYRCPDCRKVMRIGDIPNGKACPCGAVPELPDDVLTPLPGIPGQIEQALAHLGADMISSRDNHDELTNSMWSVDNDGTRIQIYWTPGAPLFSYFARICKLPESMESINGLYQFLLDENTQMQSFKFSMMQDDIILAHRNEHVPARVSQWQYHFEQIYAALRHYRPLLLETYGCRPIHFYN